MNIRYDLSPEQLYKIDGLCDKLNGSQMFGYERIQFWQSYFREKHELDYVGGLSIHYGSHYLKGEEHNITWFLLNLN